MNPTNDASGLAGLRVLMAEDEMALAMSLEMLLENYDCNVVTAARVPQALELARAERFDGALLDVNLDGVAVYPVAEALAARDVPFIFITGYSASHIEAPWHEQPVLEKPFAPEKLQQFMASTFAVTP